MQKIFLILLCLFSFRAISQSSSSALVLYNESQLLVSQSPAKAFPLLESAITKAKAAGEDSVEMLCILSLTSLRFSEPHQRKKILEWADEIFKKSYRYDSVTTGELHFHVAGILYSQSIKSDSALVHYKAAIALLESQKQKKAAELAAFCYSEMGDIFKYRTIDFIEAERCYERALELLDRINSNDPFELTRLYYNLAATNRSQHDYEKALAYATKTLAIVTQRRDYQFLEITYNMLGNIYRDRGEFQQAMDQYHRAISLNKKTKNSSRTNLAAHYTNLAEALRQEGRLEESLKHFEIAAGVFKNESGSDQQLYIFCLQQMIKAYLRINNDEKASDTFGVLRNLLKQLNLTKSKQSGEMFKSFGYYHLQKHDPESALKWFQNSLQATLKAWQSDDPSKNPALDEIGTQYYLFDVFYLKALALESIYRKTNEVKMLASAVDCLTISEKLLAAGRSSLDVEQSKWKFLDISFDLNDNSVGFDLYEKAIGLLYELSQKQAIDSVNQKAFYFFERSKALALSNAISDGKRSARLGISDSLLQQRENLKISSFQLQSKLERETDENTVRQLREEMVTLDRKLQRWKDHVKKKYPGYFMVEYTHDIPGINELQLWSREENITVVEYFMGNDNVYVLAMDDQTILFKRIASVDSLTVPIKNLIVHLTGTQSSLDRDTFVQYHTSAYSVYRQLIEPISSQIRHDRVMIIPDRLISQIPFEILLERPAQTVSVNYKGLSYFMLGHAFSYAYSATSFLSSAPYERKTVDLLAMGFTNGNRLRAPDPLMKDIIGTEKELEALSKYFTRGKFLTGDQATEFNFKTLVPRYDIIHLAIHGKGDPEQNYSSSLYFRSFTDSVEDGELHAYELYGLKLKARLAVLSACESGLGKSYTGEGMVSMASAFTYAGCQDILMSLWKVQDQIAVDLMDGFYKELMTGKTIDEALALSKIHYLKQADGLTADPRIWAPMISYGNQEPLFAKKESKLVYYFAGIALGLLLIALFVLKRKARIF